MVGFITNAFQGKDLAISSTIGTGLAFAIANKPEKDDLWYLAGFVAFAVLSFPKNGALQNHVVNGLTALLTASFWLKGLNEGIYNDSLGNLFESIPFINQFL